MIRFVIAFALSLSPFLCWSQCNHCLMTGGPEIYFLERIRPGGTQQSGWFDGLRLGIDRIKINGWYGGGDIFYSKGNLKGSTASGSALVSVMQDQIYEVRVGYTLGQKVFHPNKLLRLCYFFTPFIGWGHFEEINDFHPPSPLPCRFTDTFNFFSGGFLSGLNFNSLLSIGINFKLKFMNNGQSKISNDPLFSEVTLLIKDEIHLRLGIPIAFNPPNTLFNMGFLISPFFEYRHFGGKEGFPFNYKETEFYLYGTQVALTYRF